MIWSNSILLFAIFNVSNLYVSKEFWAKLPIKFLCHWNGSRTSSHLKVFWLGLLTSAECSVKGVKTEWEQVWANVIRFAIYAMKSKQTYQSSKTMTMAWWLEVRYALQFWPVSCNLLPLYIHPICMAWHDMEWHVNYHTINYHTNYMVGL